MGTESPTFPLLSDTIDPDSACTWKAKYSGVRSPVHFSVAIHA